MPKLVHKRARRGLAEETGEPWTAKPREWDRMKQPQNKTPQQMILVEWKMLSSLMK